MSGTYKLEPQLQSIIVITGCTMKTIVISIKVLQKQLWQVLLQLGNKPSLPSLLRWKFILGEQIDKYTRKIIHALRNII